VIVLLSSLYTNGHPAPTPTPPTAAPDSLHAHYAFSVHGVWVEGKTLTFTPAGGRGYSKAPQERVLGNAKYNLSLLNKKKKKDKNKKN
jgi:hypothetical protein